ncbi:hypothetical protein CYLTODRAFT_31332 [Cylindrobasidium torrendii FP15055 ss-10]|uniref:Uncharacterized protein n=1 Tax=Cylindrobasidium torrendii FP15055 ss-10 TaxID=1314674 RepID=A0A0D7BAF7_9AGAR|nr:hypothetical protein CYLTODRAFT_31332 [Cylindrobasidium torrendii FP15055 ss-10]
MHPRHWPAACPTMRVYHKSDLDANDFSTEQTRRKFIRKLVVKNCRRSAAAAPIRLRRAVAVHLVSLLPVITQRRCSSCTTPHAQIKSNGIGTSIFNGEGRQDFERACSELGRATSPSCRLLITNLRLYNPCPTYRAYANATTLSYILGSPNAASSTRAPLRPIPARFPSIP